VEAEIAAGEPAVGRRQEDDVVLEGREERVVRAILNLNGLGVWDLALRQGLVDFPLLLYLNSKTKKDAIFDFIILQSHQYEDHTPLNRGVGREGFLFRLADLPQYTCHSCATRLITQK
jgi:hypothetical protein